MASPKLPNFPLLYQVNTAARLNDLKTPQRTSTTFDDIDTNLIDKYSSIGADILWQLGVWQTGMKSREISRSKPDWLHEFRDYLPDLKTEDIIGSCFAISAYRVKDSFGGERKMQAFRERLNKAGIELLLDFVPNHTGLDNPWIIDHPEYFIHGDGTDFVREPQNYFHATTNKGERILAHGRDPYYDGWPDTAQLNFRSKALRETMIQELLYIASLSGGVRCDMAMLLLPEVIERTWGHRSLPADSSKPVDTSFWLEAIPRVKEKYPNFIFIAEVYWNLEWTLQNQGFDFTYDKRLYDRLKACDISGVRDHLKADINFQNKLARFIENHDEARAAATFPGSYYKPAALVTFTVPGLRFFHDGQLTGATKKLPVHVGRYLHEEKNLEIEKFSSSLLLALKSETLRTGNWQILDPKPAWSENHTHNNFIISLWTKPGHPSFLSIANLANYQSQCLVNIQGLNVSQQNVKLVDQLGDISYVRDISEMSNNGLFLDMPSHGVHLFKIN